MENIKPTLSRPVSSSSANVDNKFKQSEFNLNETDSLLNEKEQSLKKKIFSLPKMEALIFSDPKLTAIYDNMAAKGAEEFGYHYNETINNIMFNDYVLTSPKYLQKYKMAIPKKKKRRDKSGINQLKQAGELKMHPSGTNIDNPKPIAETTSAGSAGGDAGYVGYATPAAWAKSGKPKASKPLIPNGILIQEAYLTDPKIFELLSEEFNREDIIDKIGDNSDEFGNSTKNMSNGNLNIIKNDLENKKYDGNVSEKLPVKIDEYNYDEFATTDNNMSPNEKAQTYLPTLQAIANRCNSIEEVSMVIKKFLNKYDILNTNEAIACIKLVGSLYKNKIKNTEMNVNETGEWEAKQDLTQLQNNSNSSRNQAMQYLPKLDDIISNSINKDQFAKNIGNFIRSNNINDSELATHIIDLAYTKFKSNGQTIEEGVAINDSKIEKIVQFINSLIAQAVDVDGDPIPVLDKSQTWEQPYAYSPIVYRNGKLIITSTPIPNYHNEQPTVEVILKRNMEFDGIPTLKLISRMYKNAIKNKDKYNAKLQTTDDDLDDYGNNLREESQTMIGDNPTSMKMQASQGTQSQGMEVGMNSTSGGGGMSENINLNKNTNDMKESIDTDRYENVVFLQGEEANEPLEILNNEGQDAALNYLKQWHDHGNHEGSSELGHGSSDNTYEKDGYIMSWNSRIGYIGLQYEFNNEIDEMLSELEELSALQENLKVIAEERKTSSMILVDRLGNDNAKNFKKDLQHSGTKDTIDIEKSLEYKDQQTDVNKNPYKTGEDIENASTKESFKNVGNSANLAGDEIPKRNLTTEEQEEVNNYKLGLGDVAFDGEVGERFEKRMKTDMGDDRYAQRQENLKTRANMPMYNKEAQPTINKETESKYEKGLAESIMITGRYSDILNKSHMFDFMLNETVVAKEVGDDWYQIKVDGLGNTYANKLNENTSKLDVNKTVVNVIELYKFYLKADNKKVFAVKNNVILNESVDSKSVVNNLEVNKMRHLLGYNPNVFVETKNNKRI